MRSCVQVSVAMDAKDLRTEPALSERNNDSSKYSQSGGIALHCDRNKSYQDIGSNSLPKVEVQSGRPCAVIGPDRVVPPPVPNESYTKKGSSEPWPCMENTYHTRRPPEYPHKLANFQNPTRNISPRQTFQENMQRIMVPPSYNSVKICEDTNYTQISERSNVLHKNIKINVPTDTKFCDVPYTVFPPNSEQKTVRNPDMCLPHVNPNLTRTAPHGWPSSVNVRPSRTYGAPEMYQYQEYPNCVGARPTVPRPSRTPGEEQGYVYAEPFYHQEGNIRFKPYPPPKDRFPQQRYDYVSNYANTFHPQPTFPSHKYDIQKPVPPHPYPPYPPIKYVDRVSEPVIEGYQRNQQGTYNVAYRNQLIHHNFGPALGGPQNKIHSYPPDGHIKSVGPNKIPYENAKNYIEYENGRPKMYPQSESYLINEMGRMHPMKNQVIMPNYASLNMHNIPQNQYYRKDSQAIKSYDYIHAHFRTVDPNISMHNTMARHPPVFSPNTLAISPSDSSASNDTGQTSGMPQEDCGYVSQSSTASVRSIDSSMNRMPNDYTRKYYDNRFGPIIRPSGMMSKSELNNTSGSKEKKNIDVRQFLQMWNEGDEETEDNTPKGIIQAVPKSDANFSKAHDVSQANQEQLYVLGLVNVPSEELGKYEHIQKVSKLPENIKGYNHIELLNQFEEAIESSNMNNYKGSKDFHVASKAVLHNKVACNLPSRPLSPLDVEAKISQSVIHKEVGCNFEIKPCSPKMMNVEVATPVQNILSERVIEKVANPVVLKSPRLTSVDENIDCNILKRNDHRLNINNEANRIPSCKMVNTPFSNNNSIDTIKNTYSLQDLESNSGLCLASLPRLDNDIELNFPEVNQQFINANKKDSTYLSSSPKDLPTLEALEPDNQKNDKPNEVNSLTHEADSLKFRCVDLEKEFSKLSKYRKTRIHSLAPKDNIHAVRTDSVIIKNPENIKNYEENSMLSPNSVVKPVNESQQAPINLTSQGNVTELSNCESFISNPEATNKNIEGSIGIAIDFSLKNITHDDVEYMDMTMHKATESSPYNKSESSNSLSKDPEDNLPNICDTQENYINHCTNDEINEKDPISEIYANTHADLIKAASIEDTLTKSKYTQEKRNNESKEEYLSSVKYVEADNSNALLPMDFVTTTPVDLLQTTESTDNYIMDIDKNIEISMSHLDRTDSSQTPPTKSKEEDPKHVNEHDVSPKDTKATNSEGRNNAELPQLEREDEPITIFNIEKNEEEINSTLDLANNLKSSCEHSFPSVAVDDQNHSHFNVSLTSNNELGDKTSHSVPETVEQNVSAIIVNSLSNTYGESISLEKSEQEEDHRSGSIERDFFSNFNMPSPNHIVMSKQNSPSINTNGENDSYFDMETLTDTGMDSKDNISPLSMQINTVSTLEVSTPKNSCTNETETLFVKQNCDSINSNNIEVTSEDTQKRADDPIHKIPLKNDNSSCETSSVGNIELNIPHKSPESLNEEHIFRNIEYVPYFSKKMYSPTIQNLIMFLEGSVLYINNNVDNEGHNTSSLSQPEIEQMKVQDCNSIQTTEATEDFSSPDICMREIIHKSLKENQLDIEVHQIESENSENNQNVTELDKAYDNEMPTLDDVTKFSEECSDNKGCEVDHCTSPLNENNSDKLDIHCSPSISCEQQDKESYSNCEVTDPDNRYKENEENPEEHDIDREFNSQISDQLEIKHSNEISSHWITSSNSEDGASNQSNKEKSRKYCQDLPKESNKQNICNNESSQEWAPVTSWNDELLEEWDAHSHKNDEVYPQNDKQSNDNSKVLSQCNEDAGCNDAIRDLHKLAKESLEESNSIAEESKKLTQASDTCEGVNHSVEQSRVDDTHEEPSNNVLSSYHLKNTESNFSNKTKQPLKRSLSDSALNTYNSNEPSQQENEERVHFIWPFKRRKMNSVDNDVLAQSLCNILQSNRRNSIASIYNEENVSFCILIDNTCIESEEENEEQEKICYTDTSEVCLGEAQNDCITENEHAKINPEILSNQEQEESHCEYSDSYVLDDEDGKLEESWVEDVACVETVISDDIAEDIEISGPSPPRDDDIFSDNDESGVFSSTEHTDKVKYIYGDKMCNDDAHFVETLYNTPQMDVNKTLIQRETLMSAEYYDNDSLEKILSESNDEQTAYIPAYSGPLFATNTLEVKNKASNKENMDVEVNNPLQNIGHALDVGDKEFLEHNEKTENHNIFYNTQDDTVHSCESSVDNVFTYKDNDENPKYITSSSPEVSSTTSEEKNSAILLKITNYKGSRVSQINDRIIDSKSPSCKFTEEKGYVQSHANFPSHRPLLTKAAQKYIPPLKESIRDLKVKLSLPQHSLIKLKQLKKSKDDPKVCKQNISVPKILMKPKPKFEDVLKSIDEIQFKMHKEKKKSKKSIPKVVIKKNENGSHYASTSNRNDFNPDLTGRKWQPWVFIEKNHFIDKMAIKHKTKAVYSHRKQTFVLAEKFHKYKSVHSATKFVISPPLSDSSATGLKYTIRLKHTY